MTIVTHKDYFAAITRSCTSIFEGLAVTLSWLIRKPHTIQYPDRMDQPMDKSIPDGSRGILEVDVHICSACLLCQNTCPIDVIMIDTEKDAAGQRYLTRFDIDSAKCMHCGLCTEVCATEAIRHSKEFAFPVPDLRQLILHFIDAPTIPTKASKSGPPPETPPPGTILRKLLERQRSGYVPYTSPAVPQVSVPETKNAEKEPVQ